MKTVLISLSLLLVTNICFAQRYKILESNDEKIIVEINFENTYRIIDTLIDGTKVQVIRGPEFSLRNVGEPWLPVYNFSIGVPHSAEPNLTSIVVDKVSYEDKFIIPFPDEDPEFAEYKLTSADKEIYSSNKFFPQNTSEIVSDFIFRYARILNIQISPFQFNPVSRQLILNKKNTVTINYNSKNNFVGESVDDNFTNSILKTIIINYSEASNWLQKNSTTINKPLGPEYWYNPLKNYYKIYLKEKGVYRITYETLESLNVQIQGVEINKLQVFAEGEEVPLYTKDLNGNGIFENGDYFEFVGYPPPPSPFSGLNIYNLENVVWFSYQADTSGLRFTPKDSYPVTWQNTYLSSSHTFHYEVDSLYENLGHAQNNQRDYWYWGKTSGTNGNLTSLFTGVFPAPENISLPLTTLKITVNMHGMTFNNCNPDHRVKFYFTSQLIGEYTWDGYNSSTFQTTVDLTQINLYQSNNFQIAAYGDYPICGADTNRVDEIRVNWFEIEYTRGHRANENNFTFKSPESVSGLNRLQVFNWLRDDMKIFAPDHNEILVNPWFVNDQYHSVLFVDSLYERTEYFCVAEDYFLLPDSIVKDASISDLRNVSNGSDYIIITHTDFKNVAEQLENFRSTNFPDTSITNPRIIIVDVGDIYDEFAFGLLDPSSIHGFIKYAFENWEAPAPAYVVLFGDMSHDYRNFLENSRPNFIPSMPYHSSVFGQAASDNLFITVAGNDQIPDLAIGRISCESVEEGNILVDKIMSYPDDQSKKWRQNALLISSGQSLNDEQLFGFNDSHLDIDNNFIKPYGYSSTKVFRYPSKPEHEPFQGSTPEIREGFNDGAVITSYYGHGGGYQWDLVFTNDDIYELNNGGKLPFISSVTCLTGHFNNQDAFGEQFVKVPGKGAISFWGSSGLTFWGQGKSLNRLMFDEVIRNYSSVTGKFILASKIRLGTSGINQNNLTTLFGDPALQIILPYKPDFVLVPSDITINPRTPVVNQNVEIIVNLKNYGRDFPGDSVVVQLFANTSDTSYIIAEIKHHNFGEYDSILVNWIPELGGLYTLTVNINETEIISEVDHSDNETSIVFAVFDLGEPSIIEPINGYISPDGKIDFIFIDNGYYIDRYVEYLIEIDTSIDFLDPVIESSELIPERGLLKWYSPVLQEGRYFWRARILVEGDSTVWTEPRVLSVNNNSVNKGYNIFGKSLLSLDDNNMIYSEALEGLILNTDTLPPRPSNDPFNNTFVEFIEFQLPSDIIGLNTITTDGSYLYYAHIAWSGGPSKIYKLGTGYNGTVKGQDYGAIPNLEVPIWHQMFYSPDNEGGHIYVATGDAFSLLKVDVITGDTSRVIIPDGMLNDQDALVHDGGFRVTSNGRYVYNLAYKDSSGNYKYKIRTFDPFNNWSKISDDITPTGNSYNHFMSFFVAEEYLYPYEIYWSYMRRLQLPNGIYEDEWVSFQPFQGFYAWTYDWVNDKVYASVSYPGFASKFAVFEGTYLNATGSVTSHRVGPAIEWNSLEYLVDTVGSAGGSFTSYLSGFNKNSRLWDTLFVDPPAHHDISTLDANQYPFLQLKFNLTDTSFGASEPIKINGLSIDYETPPELMVIREDISFDPDTILQGFNTHLSAKINNVGKRNSENVTLNYILSSPFTSREDTIIISRIVSIPESGSIELFDTLITDETIFDNIVSILVDYPGNEFFTFNNIAENNFYVARDSTRPLFKLTFDGQEIINEDIVSDKPEVIITLEDNSPLPLDTSFFTIVHTFKNTTRILRISDPDVDYSYTEYPNSQAIITWLPELEDGKHTLEILAKDASGNFFDSTSSRTNFNVFSEAGLTEVYNYPNPFANETHFTFQLRGTDLPDEVLIKVYTVAGRLIRDISLSPTELNIGFNKIRWDGKDQDGDEIGNGLYFYKMIAKFKDDTKSVTQKLAKVK